MKKSGGVKYAQHPSTEVMCVGYKIDDQPSGVWIPSQTGQMTPRDFFHAASNSGVIWIAHNALFEQSIYEWVLRRKLPGALPPLPPHRWKCTAAKAAVHALPRNLEGAANALNLPVKKNMDGRRLMLKYSKPRRAWTAWKEKGGWHDGIYKGTGPDKGWMFSGEPEKYFSDPDELQKIYDYCGTDVEAEWYLNRALPDLIPVERDIWILNQEMNLRGVQVDTETVKIILKLIGRQTLDLQNEIKTLTKGAVTTANQRDRILEFLENEGVCIPKLNAQTVAETLECEDLPPKAKRMLEIRQTLSKSSTKKYQAILARAGEDGRVRDLALYHGAHTGRESGTGLQLQNLPKGKIKNTDRAIEAIRKWADPEFLEMLYGDAFQVYSSCIRGMVTATTGQKLFAADYNAIEARVLAYLASDENMLEMFRKKRDPYLYRAAQIFNIPVDEVTPDQRFVGKIAELALGYQMGAGKFLQTCHAWGAKWVTPEIAEKAVRVFRADRQAVVKLWSRMERAATMAVQMPHKVIKLHKIAWGVRNNSLWCQLPSGRRIHYHGPEIRKEPTPWGEFRPKLYYWSVNSMTKKWECAASYGGLLTENVVQATSRDVMFHAALRMKKAGYQYLYSVHDEIVAESANGNVEQFEKLLTELPPWAQGLPITAKGWTDFRYRKG